MEKTLILGKIEGRRRREPQRMRWLDEHHPLNGHEFEQTPEMVKVKLQYFEHLIIRTNSLEKTLMLGKIESRRRRGWQRIRWLDNTDLMDRILSKVWEIVMACCSSWGHKDLDMA